MFSDLSKGFQVHALELVDDIPVYHIGKVMHVSDPRFLPPAQGTYQSPGRVIDLTVEIDGETKTYTVPETSNVGKSMGITLSTNLEAILNELDAMRRNSQEVIDSGDMHKKRIEACDRIKENISPAFRQTREQDRRISGIEDQVNKLSGSFDELKKLIVERLK